MDTCRNGRTACWVRWNIECQHRERNFPVGVVRLREDISKRALAGFSEVTLEIRMLRGHFGDLRQNRTKTSVPVEYEHSGLRVSPAQVGQELIYGAEEYLFSFPELTLRNEDIPTIDADQNVGLTLVVERSVLTYVRSSSLFPISARGGLRVKVCGRILKKAASPAKGTAIIV